MHIAYVHLNVYNYDARRDNWNADNDQYSFVLYIYMIFQIQHLNIIVTSQMNKKYLMEHFQRSPNDNNYAVLLFFE